MKKMPDRKKLRKEYIQGGVSFAELAKKYNISESTVKRWAREDGWSAARTEVSTKANLRMEDAAAEAAAQAEVGVFEIAKKLLVELDRCVEDGKGTMEVGDIRSMTAALKDLKDIRGDRDKLKEQEQKAKTAKIKQETKRIKQQTEAGSQEAKAITVTVAEEAADYGG